MVTLDIDEEYGFRRWTATLTIEEYEDLLIRWQTMKGLNCLVPVKLIIPQAKEIGDEVRFPNKVLRVHIHDHDDSWIYGFNYDIPDDENFWMDGEMYSREQIFVLRDKYD